MTVIQALVRNMRTCRCDVKGASTSSQHYKALSTDAQHRDGSSRSSDEVSVMETERRGRAIQFEEPDQPAMGGIW